MISDESFPKREHLLKSKEFSRVYKKGFSARALGVILYCLANGLEHNRLGFSIGSGNIKRATSRNRMRRLFREVYRKNKDSLKKGSDIVLVIKKDMCRDLTYDSAKATFLKLAKDVRLTV
ncbi:MAG: ribonuclease P protein component [Candidatus Omnitrophica bacterium]|nr:ribonuclease P protein component [Candidatus Omnitrophota bacterium]